MLILHRQQFHHGTLRRILRGSHKTRGFVQHHHNTALSTQLFDDRLIIEGNFGVIRGNKNDADNANNIVGDVDLTFRLTKRLSLKAYNHTNVKNNYYIYSVEDYSDFTQGVGISFSQSFDNVREIFHYNNRNKNKKTKKTKLKLDNESKPK